MTKLTPCCASTTSRCILVWRSSSWAVHRQRYMYQRMCPHQLQKSLQSFSPFSSSIPHSLSLSIFALHFSLVLFHLPILLTAFFSMWSTFSERLASIDLRNIISSSFRFNSSCSSSRWSSVLLKNPFNPSNLHLSRWAFSSSCVPSNVQLKKTIEYNVEHNWLHFAGH